MRGVAGHCVGLGAWWAGIRPRTLVASLVPVGVGLACARRGGPLHAATAALTAVTALLLQAVANLANDYYDFARGVDRATRLGPRRLAGSGIVAPRAVQRAAVGTLAAALLAGAYLVWRGGWPIAALGAGAAAASVMYSAGPRPLSHVPLGEVLAFAFFGPVAVGGTVFLQTRALDPLALFLSVPVGCLVSAIMAVNNLRDIPTDAEAGKRTLAVRLGAAGARRLYASLVGAGFVLLLPPALRFGAPGVLLPLAAVPLGVAEVRAACRRRGAELNASLAGTARLLGVFGALLIVGLLL